MNGCTDILLISTIACRIAECLDDNELALLAADLLLLSDSLNAIAVRRAICNDICEKQTADAEKNNKNNKDNKDNKDSEDNKDNKNSKSSKDNGSRQSNESNDNSIRQIGDKNNTITPAISEQGFVRSNMKTTFTHKNSSMKISDSKSVDMEGNNSNNIKK
ncbi:DUF6774 domain-containing protein [Lachnoclostridium sp.]|uniref:DUF6774 domain-containing protein n=1 Tax=Lachnoclostridium sp. TaxID=2028282 RepID=UPI0026A7F427|nr:DUF6774 domain-containing protein [Lachnoclostridium sp.]